MVSIDDGLPIETVIWRYLKLNAFLELVNGDFALTRADMVNDALEGAYDWRSLILSNDAIESLGLPLQRRVDWELGRHYPYIDYPVPDLIRTARQQTLLSCWTGFKNESFAMWNTYGRPRESVAIISTVGKLANLIDSVLPEDRFEGMRHRLGRVSYEPLVGQVSDVSELFLHKRPHFVSEIEVRLIGWTSTAVSSIYVPKVESPFTSLVDAVIVAPGSRSMFFKAVENVIRNTFGEHTCEVRTSALDDDLLPEN